MIAVRSAVLFLFTVGTSPPHHFVVIPKPPCHAARVVLLQQSGESVHETDMSPLSPTPGLLHVWISNRWVICNWQRGTENQNLSKRTHSNVPPSAPQPCSFLQPFSVKGCAMGPIINTGSPKPSSTPSLP